MAEFVLDKAFEALYAGVEDLIVKNFIFKSLFADAKSRLDESYSTTDPGDGSI